MDAQYDIQWIQHHSAVDMKNDLIIEENEHEDSDCEFLQQQFSNNNNDDDDDDDDDDGMNADVDATNIDQIAAENLIFMARDGQVVTEILTNAAEQGVIMSPASSVNNGNIEYDSPQMVTEEVITDDWVQRQGAERVEIPVDQIIGSSSQVVLDMEVPLPTVQDEYTALRPYPCDFCSRRFRKKISLMNHMVAHQNDRPNLCKLCGSRFFRRSDLISHLKAHADTPDNDRNIQVDLSGFVGQNHHQKQFDQSSDNCYYDYNEYTSTIDRDPRDFDRINNGNDNSLSTSMVRTGRISRLRPKKHAFSLEETEVLSTRRNSETNCQNFKSSMESVDFLPEKKCQTRFYPILDESKPFVCQQCGLAFAREKALSSHIKNHRNEAPYECDQCNEMFWDKESLQDHQKGHQFEASNSEYDPDEVEEETQSESEADPLYGEFYCSQCGVSFHRQDLLKRHAKIHMQVSNDDVVDLVDKSGQHCCNTCGETFEEALDLLAHAEIHARYPPFKCVLCGESFFEETTIKRHLLSQHENSMTINSCILCGKECRDRKALIKHAWDHSREKCHSCSKCGKSFHNKARLKRHMTSHRDKSVICNICFEEFPDGRSLSNHRHSHSTSSAGKMFPCNECGKTFGSRSSQQIHVRIHTGEKPYGCRYCWKAFADGGTLRKHERIHTGEKPYVCSVCSRAFNQRVVLREHIRSHHSGLDIKRGTFFCSLCQESLASSSDLVQHLIQHSDVNTAKQRKPITGPRKYKRRRKLKPHEIERLHRTSQNDQNYANDSDVDVTDVDDFLDVNDEISISNNRRGIKSNPTTTTTTTTTTTNELSKSNRSKSMRNESIIEPNVVDDASDSSRTRYSSTNSNSEKFWTSRLGHTIHHTPAHDESLLLNVENTLQSIDALVVGNDRENDYTTMHESNAQRTQHFQPKRNAKATNPTTTTTTATACVVETMRTRRTRQNTAKEIKRPHMIHTEKQRCPNIPNSTANSNNNETRQRRTVTTTTTTTTTRMLITRNDAAATTTTATTTTSLPSSFELLPSKALTIVDDYEIISPATQPPHQISSSPVHIKHEENDQHYRQHSHQQQQHQQHQQNQQQIQQFQQHHQQQQSLQENNMEQRRRRRYLTSQSSQTSRSSDLYDAQLLLDAATLRKDCYEKYNPNIVNELDEILRSPLKTDKLDERMRNTSECSTTQQYLGEQSEEEAGLIKLEPSSPDFQALFNCTNNGNASNNSNNKTSERTRTSRNQLTSNRRYLEFETDATANIPTATETKIMTRQSTTKQTEHSVDNDDDNDVRQNITRRSLRKTKSVSLKSNNNYSNNSFNNSNNHIVVNTNNVAANTAELVHAYDSMSAIDSASAAGVNATKHQTTEKRNKYYFECEMCSMVFTDRAQLLDHVPIHI